MKNNLDHPCKETCSGWKQGFESGVDKWRALCQEMADTIDFVNASSGPSFEQAVKVLLTDWKQKFEQAAKGDT